MIKDWELHIIGEKLTELLGKEIEVGTVSLLRRLVDDYQTLINERSAVKDDIETLMTHLTSTSHPSRCPDCVHSARKILVKVSRR